MKTNWATIKDALIRGVCPKRLLKLDGPDMDAWSRAVCRCLSRGEDPRKSCVVLNQEPQHSWKWQSRYHFSWVVPTTNTNCIGFYTILTFGGPYIMNSNGNWRGGSYPYDDEQAMKTRDDIHKKIDELNEIPLILFLFEGR
jgi:hypothetical protein